MSDWKDDPVVDDRWKQDPIVKKSRELTHEESFRARPVQEFGDITDILRGAAGGLKSLGLGAKQRLAETGLAWPILGVEFPPRPEEAKALSEREAAFRERQSFDSDYTGGEKAGHMIGQAIPLAASAFLPGGQSTLGSGLYGSLWAYNLPTASPNEKYQNVGTVGPAAAGTQLAFNTLLPRIKLEPERLPTVLANRGAVPIKPGQVSRDRYLQQVEASAQRNPWVSDIARRNQAAQIDAFNNELARKVGLKHKVDFFNPEALEEASSGITSKMVAPIRNGVDVDSRLIMPILDVEDALMRNSEIIGDNVRPALGIIKRIQRVENSRITGQEWKEVHTLIGEQTSKAFNNKDYSLGTQLSKLKSIWEDVGLSSAPQKMKDDFKLSLKQYANLKTIEEALLKSDEGAFGNVDPTKVFKTVEGSMPGGVLRNKADLAHLARVGQLMKDTSTIATSTSPLARLKPSAIANALAYLGLNSRTTRPIIEAAMINPNSRALVEQSVKAALIEKLLESGQPENVSYRFEQLRKLLGDDNKEDVTK